MHQKVLIVLTWLTPDTQFRMPNTFLNLNIATTAIYVLLSALSIHCDRSMSDVHTSTFLLKRLVEDELTFLEDLNSYVSAIEYHAKQVHHYINTVYSSFNPGDDFEALISNPLNTLGVVKRTGFEFTLGLQHILNNRTWIDLQEKLINISSTRFPTMQDYYETCISIAFLQNVYSLNISELGNGVVKTMHNERHNMTFKSKFKLTWILMYEIGIVASDHGWHDSGHIWFKMAIDKCLDKKNPLFLELKQAYKKNMEIHDYKLEIRGRKQESNKEVRTFALPFHKELRKKKKYRKLFRRLKPEAKDDLSEVDRIKHYVTLFQVNSTQFKHGTYTQLHTQDNFNSLCKDGEKKWRTPEINKNLTCRFQHHQNPYLKLGPFLLEEKNYKPLVVLFHKLMSQYEINYFKYSGSKEMRRSGIGLAKTSSIRTSQQGWIEERMYRFPTTDKFKGWDYNGAFHTTGQINGTTTPDYPSNVQDYLIIKDIITHNVTKRIELATTLVLDRPYASESYQVANYGVGGQYATHADVRNYHSYSGGINKLITPKHWYSLLGDRHATFMVYLSTVELGGSTVFPLLGLSNNAIAGDALFWTNMWSDARTDYLSVHGGCPILLGSKWITNKFIHYYDNFRGSPCELEEFQRSETFNMWRKSSL